MLNYYLRTELKYKSKLPYAIYGDVYPWNWNYGEGNMRSMGLNIGEILRKAMSENQFLNVFVANGYYDGATPYFGTEYTFSQIGLNSEFKDRVSMGYYEAGHMMYIPEKRINDEKICHRFRLRNQLLPFSYCQPGKWK
jgi:carboxypeptidase C (cathepsin A)